MKEYDLKKLIDNPELLNKNITDSLENKSLLKQEVDKEEIKGHILKAEHNLRFVAEGSTKNFPDWAITGCYYACYHAALALMQTKGFTSKNHLATLCIIIKEFYKKEITEEDIEMLSKLIDYEELLFYVESKNKREDATYSTKTLFEKGEVEKLRIKAVLFVNKIKEILTKPL